MRNINEIHTKKTGSIIVLAFTHLVLLFCLWNKKHFFNYELFVWQHNCKFKPRACENLKNKRVKNVYQKLTNSLFIRKQSRNKSFRRCPSLSSSVCVYERVRVCVWNFHIFYLTSPLFFSFHRSPTISYMFGWKCISFCCCLVSIPPRYSLIVFMSSKKKEREIK